MTHQEKIKLTNDIAQAIMMGSVTMGHICKEGCFKFTLPKPQVAGTIEQQKTYAMIQAIDMVVQYKKYLVE